MQKLKLADISTIYSGFAFKANELKANGIPVIKIANIQNRQVLKGCITSLPERLFNEKLKRFILSKDDILIAMTGAGSVGKIGKMRKVDGTYLVNQRVGIIKIDKQKANPEFIYQKLSCDYYEDYYYGLGLGAGQPNLSPTDIGGLEIEVPSIDVQIKIASILSAYDDLIENNTRRIQILEQMAQAIYKEWFVKFRIENSELRITKEGIPEGWERKDLSDIANILMGQSPKSEFYNSEGIGLPFHQGVTDFGFRFPKHNAYCSVENRIAEVNDILFSVRAPVGRINIANKRLIIGRGLSAIQHKGNLQSFLFYQLKHIFSEEDTIGSGAIFNSVTKDDMHKIKVICPSDKHDKNFDELITPIDSQILNLNSKINNLRRTRDLLLPKLMSGEVEV